jgi:hypothetical protein
MADLGRIEPGVSSGGIDVSRHAFKEWAIVCDSIARGETSLIFRKGGIAEGRDGFHFKYQRFFLFPTYFHEQIERTRLGSDRTLEPAPDSVVVTLFLGVEFSRWVEDLDWLAELEKFHILKSSVLRERFCYENRKGLYVAFVRAYRLSATWKFAFQRSYGGCRSWVELPEPPQDLQITPILDSAEQSRRRSVVLAALDKRGAYQPRSSHGCHM